MSETEFAPEETPELADAKRRGDPYLVYGDARERQCVLSRNGTFVNDRRVEGRRRLMDGDLVRCGETLPLFVAPFQAADQTRAARTLQ